MPAVTRSERHILGGAVFRIRKLKGITQDELATQVGIHFAYLSNIERDKKQPSEKVIRAIADALEVDLRDISYKTVVYLADEDAA
jgi:transcriptional regulator with XRE-family HTH domain